MAYGARLESVLGASPRGFESPILRSWILFQIPRNAFSGIGKVSGSSAAAGDDAALLFSQLVVLCF